MSVKTIYLCHLQGHSSNGQFGGNEREGAKDEILILFFIHFYGHEEAICPLQHEGGLLVFCQSLR
jgi:hypothetical protein